MKLDKNYIGTKWIVNEANFPLSKGCSAIIKDIYKGSDNVITVYYIYFYRDETSFTNVDYSEEAFLASFIIYDKTYLLMASINKIKDSL